LSDDFKALLERHGIGPFESDVTCPLVAESRFVDYS
jgi:hypothetical protein